MKISIKSIAAFALVAFISSAAVAGSMSVSDVHTMRTELAGMQVSVTGKVIKVNNGIMRRNFIHVSDGTKYGDNDRVIFTSQQTAKVGDMVTATGTLVLDTDFTMGYFYPTLVEKATFTPAN